MKISIIGSRGIPARYGGFETFTAHLAEYFALNKHEVLVVNDAEQKERYSGKVKIIVSKYAKSKNPLKFYRDSLKIASIHSEIVLVCGVGGAIFYPFYKNRSFKIITNVDGLEHKREKYSLIKKIFVRMAQVFAGNYSDHLIADSESVSHYWKSVHAVAMDKISVIAYGADEPDIEDDTVLNDLKISANQYYLVVARLVPENNIIQIIKAFTNSGSGKKLVIVGDLDKSDYSDKIRKFEDDSIVLAGSIYNREKLNALRKKSFAYLHGHSVGGTNPSLVEAMASKCLCIVHKNEFNLETLSMNSLSFGSVAELKELLSEIEKFPESKIQYYRDLGYDIFKNKYSWEQIDSKYLNLFIRLNG